VPYFGVSSTFHIQLDYNIVPSITYSWGVPHPTIYVLWNNENRQVNMATATASVPASVHGAESHASMGLSVAYIVNGYGILHGIADLFKF